MFDLSNVPEFTGKGILPAGEYLAIIANAEVTKSKAGSPMIKVTFEVNGQSLWDYLVLDPKNPKSYAMGMSKAKSILAAIGSTQTNFRNELDMADAMEGELTVTIDVKEEEYQGERKPKNFIKKYSTAPVIHKVRPSRSTIPF
ncbi:MAG: DUF669 domain-containing protein [Bacteriovoracales bacterium]